MRASSQLMRPPLCHCGWSCRRPSVAILACWPLDLICTLRRRGRHDGGGGSDVDEDDDGDDEFMDMASGGWVGFFWRRVGRGARGWDTLRRGRKEQRRPQRTPWGTGGTIGSIQRRRH